MPFAAEVKLDPKQDYNEMTTSQLRQLLQDQGIDCRGFLEKADFVSRVQELARAAS